MKKDKYFKFFFIINCILFINTACYIEYNTYFCPIEREGLAETISYFILCFTVIMFILIQYDISRVIGYIMIILSLLFILYVWAHAIGIVPV
jgi:hypothetical protein